MVNICGRKMYPTVFLREYCALLAIISTPNWTCCRGETHAGFIPAHLTSNQAMANKSVLIERSQAVAKPTTLWLVICLSLVSESTTSKLYHQQQAPYPKVRSTEGWYS